MEVHNNSFGGVYRRDQSFSESTFCCWRGWPQPDICMRPLHSRWTIRHPRSRSTFSQRSHPGNLLPRKRFHQFPNSIHRHFTYGSVQPIGRDSSRLQVISSTNGQVRSWGTGRLALPRLIRVIWAPRRCSPNCGRRRPTLCSIYPIALSRIHPYAVVGVELLQIHADREREQLCWSSLRTPVLLIYGGGADFDISKRVGGISPTMVGSRN